MTCAPNPQVSPHDRKGILTGVLVVSAAAWVWVAVSAAPGMSVPLRFTSAAMMWFVMMLAMMLPSVTPWFFVFAGLTRHDVLTGDRVLRLMAFGVGYASVWLVFSVLAGSVHTLTGSALSDRLGAGSVLGGLLLIGAGVYQLTPAKAACLRHCRSPLGYFLTRWRSGTAGALRMGFGHGLFCLACCWALMALAFVLGVMHVGWMLALTAVVAAEKLLPKGELASRVLGMALVIWGIAAV